MPKWFSFAPFLAAVFIVGLSGSRFMPGVWYASLEKPPWTPPNWLFAPAWTALYLVIAIAGWLVWQREGVGMTLWFWCANLLADGQSLGAPSACVAGDWARPLALTIPNRTVTIGQQPSIVARLGHAEKLPQFQSVNTVLGNIKIAINGTYRAVRKHVDRTLAEFEWRFNRRYDLAAMIPRLAWAATRRAADAVSATKAG